MSDYIVSADPGNGGTNAVMATKGKSYKSVYFPSVRAAASGDSLGLGGRFELEYEYVDWGGHRYVVGEDVLTVTRRHLERHTGINRYGNELHRFLVAVALARLGVSKGKVDLTLFAPPGMYLDAQQAIHHNFLDKDGKVAVKLKADKKPRVWHYDCVRVWPEGIGAAACFVLDAKGQAVDSGILSGDAVVLDMGAYTLDALKMNDGSFNPESLEHATWENGGVMTHILEPILKQIRKHGADFDLLTTDDIDRVLRQGLETGDYTLTVAGHEVDMTALVAKYRERYAGWIANNIVDGVFSGFRGIKSVVLVGGGALLVEDFLQQWYAGKVMDRKKHSSTAGIHPVYFNAVGGLRLALAGQG